MTMPTQFIPDDSTGAKKPNEVLGEQLLGVLKNNTKIVKIERKKDQQPGWTITYEE